MLQAKMRLQRTLAALLAIGTLVAIAPASGVTASLVQAAAAMNGGPGGGP
jgi:hypothetical protein